VRLGARESKETGSSSAAISSLVGSPADGAPAVIGAVEEIWRRAGRQHCDVRRLRNLQASCPSQSTIGIRFNYWSVLTYATSVKDGKLRLQVLISQLEHRG
jgi:hypothetical protein